MIVCDVSDRLVISSLLKASVEVAVKHMTGTALRISDRTSANLP